jgi:hypothetical protein
MRAFNATGVSRGIPLILVGERRLQGYSRPAYEALFKPAQ